MHFNLHDRPNLHSQQMESSLNQLISDLSYSIDTLGMKDEHMEEFFPLCDEHQITPEYFAEEFICMSISRDQGAIHDDEYLSLDSFNAYHGSYFEEVE